MLKLLFPILVLFASQIVVAQQAGTLDQNFGDDGVSITNSSSFSHEPEKLIVQPNGKIVVAGGASEVGPLDLFIFRYSKNGELDDSFGNGGKVFFDLGEKEDWCQDLELLDDGSFLMMVQSNNVAADFIFLHFFADGTLDQEYGGDGLLEIDIEEDVFPQDFIVDEEQNIFVTGRIGVTELKSIIVLMKIKANGTLDETFGNNGWSTFENSLPYHNQGEKVLLQSTGKIVVVGNELPVPSGGDITMVRFNANGELDPTFGLNDNRTLPLESSLSAGLDVYVRFNDIMMLAGWTKLGPGFKFMLVQITPSGKLDEAFGDGGTASPNFDLTHSKGKSVVRNGNGNYFIGGSAFINPNYKLGITKLQSNGELATDFGANGYIIKEDLGIKSEVIDMVMVDSGTKLLVLAKRQKELYDETDLVLLKYFPETISRVSESSIFKIKPVVFPNSTQDQFSILFDLQKTEQLSLSLFDNKGTLVHTFFTNTLFQEAIHKLTVDLPSYLSSATYHLMLQSATEQLPLLLTIIR